MKSTIMKLVLVFLGFNQWVMAADGPDPVLPEGEIQMRVETCILCHESEYSMIKSSSHWMTGDDRSPAEVQECATCHGNLQEHVLSAGEAQRSGMKTYTKTTNLLPEEQNAVCLTCHKQSTFLHWAGNGHDNADTGCVACHKLHQEDKVKSRLTETQVCYSCHTDMRVQEHKPYGHPVTEKKMVCSDCHGVHGGPGDADMKTFSINETCYTCHAEKRGPFLWEHIPVSENCALCHSPHGSINKGMLTRRQPHLCQSCHEPVLFGPGTHQRHARLGLSYGITNQLAPLPNDENRGISRLVVGESCSNCHSMVHGSNHPAGAKLTR